MPSGLHFVLILPDGSKSLVSADWTDFKTDEGRSQEPQLVGSPDDLLRLRGIVDAFLRRAASLPVISGAGQETESWLKPVLRASRGLFSSCLLIHCRPQKVSGEPFQPDRSVYPK
jgi:hypothetical protein